MQSTSLRDELEAGLSARSGERRKSPRFEMHFPDLLRTLGEPLEFSARTDQPYSAVTGAVFWNGIALCVPDGDGLYGVAVRNSGHRYLSPAEAAGFQAGASKPPDL